MHDIWCFVITTILLPHNIYKITFNILLMCLETNIIGDREKWELTFTQ